MWQLRPIILVLGRLRPKDLLNLKLTWVIEQNPVIYKHIHTVPFPQGTEDKETKLLHE